MTGIGGLIGPSIAGILYDQAGFGNSFLFIFTTHTALVTTDLISSKNNDPPTRTNLTVGVE